MALRSFVSRFRALWSCGIDNCFAALYLNPLPGSNAPPIEHSIHQVTKEASLLYCLPDNPFVKTPEGNAPPTHAVQEATYACKVALFNEKEWYLTLNRRWLDLCPALLQSPWPRVYRIEECIG